MQVANYSGPNASWQKRKLPASTDVVRTTGDARLGREGHARSPEPALKVMCVIISSAQFPWRWLAQVVGRGGRVGTRPRLETAVSFPAVSVPRKGHRCALREAVSAVGRCNRCPEKFVRSGAVIISCFNWCTPYPRAEGVFRVTIAAKDRSNSCNEWIMRSVSNSEEF